MNRTSHSRDKSGTNLGAMPAALESERDNPSVMNGSCTEKNEIQYLMTQIQMSFYKRQMCLAPHFRHRTPALPLSSCATLPILKWVGY